MRISEKSAYVCDISELKALTMTRSILALFLILSSAQLVSAQPGDGEAVFQSSIFDGKSLDGWTIENDCEAEVKDGMLLLKSGDGWLRSDLSYTDFVLKLEWKALKAEKYDAGIYIRTRPGGKPFPKQGHQINLLQDREGDLVGNKDAMSDGLIRKGQWNSIEIVAVGEMLSVSMNDKQAYILEKGLKHASGHVGFQIEVPLGGQFLIRKIEVAELTHGSLFDGKTLAGWEGAGKPKETCWKVEDGSIVCTGEKGGPWLRTAKEYGDFNLRFDYQVSPGGNSGVYVRVPKDGNHHRDDKSKPEAGFEIQVLDDQAKKYAKLKPYQFCGSLYDICGASSHVGRKAGEWNTLEINCKGQHVTTTHNGVTIVVVSPESHPLISLRKTSGFLGLQNHSTIVKFRNVRIGSAMPMK
jgi:hypothetical protein